MKSILGLILAFAAAAAFAGAYALSQRPGASWLDAQWIFLIALPYNWTLLRLTGTSDFSPDAPAQMTAAFVFNITLGYLAGAMVEALARKLWRLLIRRRSRA